MFYQNRIKARPNGENLSTVHSWSGNHEKIEHNAWFGPWLFPTFESGVNGSQALSAKEAEEFASNAQIAERLVKSYELALAFFG